MDARRLICVALWWFVLVVAVCAQSPGREPRVVRYHAMADWQLGTRVGAEVFLAPRVSIRADGGVSIFGLVLADALLGVSLADPEAPVAMQLLLGVPNAGTPVTFAGAMVSVGGTLHPSVRLGECCRLGVRLGAGFPFFFERDRPIIRETRLPLGLWPDAGVDLTWRR
jgi:hypothetical protein